MTPGSKTTTVVDTVLFDLDGTLCEYERPPGAVLALAFERARVPAFFDVTEYYDRFDEFTDDSDDIATLRADCFAAIATDHGRDPAVGRSVAAAFAAERDQSRVQFVDGAGDALDRLHDRGYDLGLVTNGPPATQRRKLHSLGVADRFGVTVFAGHDTPSKPHPEPFRRALAALTTPPERALFVGDSFGSDVVGARALGMTTAWVADDDTPPTGSVAPAHVLDSTGDLHAALSNQ
jgi:haloacid dehalogenase superfamily, subfamily IA, variant 3 with third motif having DD or ED/haloacid dehalogenase superfamily, subfamily IA, variant 1 with third motif having Dx(3-4)D or Dx(3-4)E